MAQSNNADLLETVAKLETTLETPVIPGELRSWTKEVQDALVEVKPWLKKAIEKQHPEKLGTISREDPELMRRVTQLEEQDGALLEQFQEMENAIEALRSHAEKVGIDEAKLDPQARACTDQGLALVLAIRKQEVAIETWEMEALTRDRGVAD